MASRQVSEIKNILKEADVSDLPLLIKEFEEDERAGVKSAIESANKRILKYEEEMKRVESMCYFEKKYAAFTNICGIDEVGRGPLAGPVMAAAVILPKDLRIPYINDSKKLTAAKREELYNIISEKAIAIGLGMAGQERIDEINILQATYEAMRDAIHHLKVPADYLLVDAVHIPKVDIPQAGIIKGDAKSISIAAASIIAKVTRDRIMTDYDKVYPEYGFAGNKGYGSAEHIEALKKYGPCPLHRRSFIKNFI
ncbi:MAG: ribonuclease HII [Lachnospiraceae bacterium]|nr:ribonuclease HII [Lachnospiraceae bacterium]